ncbi:uncharacterized protein C7orf50 homolog [Lampris incognitus]|uniref:uncharacterized protein C7orf50 homolog n=1 Tax=Lampris incognitus TaxID=2546036 RepID=UPI0024B4FAA7|nr:uncharacterized protein C7orf50 homolog [Lampris incognitus]
MAKSKSLELVPKSSGSKRKKISSDETEVCVDEELERKLKKKKKKKKNTEIEEPTLIIPEIQNEPDCKKQGKSHKLKDKENTEQKKKRKKAKKEEIVEPPAHLEEVEEVMEGEEDLSPEERRVLERKLKKIRKKEEKKKLKEEDKTKDKVQESRPIEPQQALDYLTCWAENRKVWKFQKTRQTWLLQHMFDSDKVPDQSFSVLLLYLEGLRGGARDTTIQKAETLVKELGATPEDEDARKRMQRAREVVQLLS